MWEMKTDDDIKKGADKWISENAQIIKDGFRKTKSFQKIIEGTLQSMRHKGWMGDAQDGVAKEDDPVEVFRPIFEELYLNGCVQGLHGQRIEMLRQIALVREDAKAEFMKMIDEVEEVYIGDDDGTSNGMWINKEEIKQKIMGGGYEN